MKNLNYISKNFFFFIFILTLSALYYGTPILSVHALSQNEQNDHSPVSFVLHLDIEPFGLPEWKEDMQKTANEFLDLVDKIVDETVPNGVIPSFDIPNWYDAIWISRHGSRKPLYQWILDKSDVCIMDYVDSAPEAISAVQNEMAYAERNDRKVVLAFETQKLETWPETSFYGFSSNRFEAELKRIDDHFGRSGRYPSYDGIAIHHYGSWKRMNPRLNIPDDAPLRDVFDWDASPVTRDRSEFYEYFAPNSRHNKVRRIYMNSLWLFNLSSTKRYFKEFILHSFRHKNLQFEVMAGKTQWALAKNHDEAMEWVRKATRFYVEYFNSPQQNQRRYYSLDGFMNERELLSLYSPNYYYQYNYNSYYKNDQKNNNLNGFHKHNDQNIKQLKTSQTKPMNNKSNPKQSSSNYTIENVDDSYCEDKMNGNYCFGDCSLNYFVCRDRRLHWKGPTYPGFVCKGGVLYSIDQCPFE